MAKREERHVTREEYLAFEESALERHEYHAGRVYAISGSSASHARITANVLVSIHLQVRGRSCEVFDGHIKVRVEASGLYTYPDVSALRGRANFESERYGVLLNPSVIVEVLSPSTESYDRGQKFAHYQRIASLREYVLVSQDRACVERFTRVDDAGTEWMLTSVVDLDGAMELPSIGCTLRLRDVYDRVEFPIDPPLRAVHEPAAIYAGAPA